MTVVAPESKIFTHCPVAMLGNPIAAVSLAAVPADSPKSLNSFPPVGFNSISINYIQFTLIAWIDELMSLNECLLARLVLLSAFMSACTIQSRFTTFNAPSLTGFDSRWIRGCSFIAFNPYLIHFHSVTSIPFTFVQSIYITFISLLRQPLLHWFTHTSIYIRVRFFNSLMKTKL